MAINKFCALALVFISAAAWSGEAASGSDCQSAAATPAIAGAKAAVERAPADLTANFGLADAWSDAGCFSDAVQVLQVAQAQHPGNKELETRLRVARSLVGEEHYFDTLDRADAEAKLKHDTFRCSTLSDPEACSEAVRLRRAAGLAPDPELSAKLNPAETPSPASESPAGARIVSAAKPQKPIRVARADRTPAPGSPIAAPGRRYSNAPKDERSH